MNNIANNLGSTVSRGALIFISVPLILAWLVVGGCGDNGGSPEEEEVQSWESELYSPTLLTRLGETYFLVDCWHNRILYNDEIDGDLLNWEVLDGELAGPHSIDTDGHFYVVDDTGHQQVRVYIRDGDGFALLQRIGDVGHRPHRVHYDEETESFYVIGSRSQTISRLVVADGGDILELKYTKDLPFLEERYTRSMSIIDGKMYFISGPGRIHKTRHRDDSYEVVETWTVPSGKHQMNDLFKIDGTYFLTNTFNWADDDIEPRNTIVQCDDLADLAEGDCIDRRDQLEIKGAPYYLSEIDGRIYVPQAFQYSGIVSFRLDEEGELYDIRTEYDTGPPSDASLDERFRLSK